MKRTKLAALVASGILGTSLTACVMEDAPTAIGKALPTAAQVKINLPDTASSNAVGQLSPWYVATRDVTRTLNGGTAWVLILVHTIVLFPPTATAGDTYTWGPWSQALDPAEYKLTVTALADGSYDWALDGHDKSQPAAAFETVIGGNAVPGGTGRFTLDFDAAERVNPRENDGQGVIGAVYDVPARSLDLSADSVQDQDGTPTPVHADYRYREQADGSGDMVFSVLGDTDDPGSLPEQATIRSRWLATGAGRADLRLRDGDLAAEVTASDCWSTSFLRVFYTDSAQWQPTEGDPAACAFADVDLPE
ncbi:MAG TPA: hypothetical protein VHE35_11185 [Kofleriaceae bacterium]|nr:hypothetical protein [Kofleriaceae bacterium]